MSCAVTLLLADFAWDAIVAIGTLLLACVTASLAWSTRALALASRKDERAQWRPAVVPGVRAPVDYDDATGALSFELRNVGRGPAFGIHAQLRSGKRALGASLPGSSAIALAPGDSYCLQARIIDPSLRIRGKVIEVDVSYADITERWHRSRLTIVGRRPPDKLRDPSVVAQLEVAKVFVYETDRYILPVLGSPRALEQQARERQRLRHRARALGVWVLDRRRRSTEPDSSE